MIPPAPSDFWDRVIKEVATMVFSRETNGVSTALPPSYASALLSRKMHDDTIVSAG